MIASWHQRMYRSLLVFYNTGALSADDVSVVCRAPYFGLYRYSVHFSPTVTNWTRFDELVASATDLIGARGKLTYNPVILQMNLFSNCPVLLREMVRFEGEMLFHAIHLIAEKCWSWRLPAPKPKGLYYGKYGYRIRFKNRHWAEDADNIAALENVTGQWMLSHTRKNFLYCDQVRDVILAKLLFSSDIEEISDRSNLRST